MGGRESEYSLTLDARQMMTTRTSDTQHQTGLKDWPRLRCTARSDFEGSERIAIILE